MRLIIYFVLALVLMACSGQSEPIVVTATFEVGVLPTMPVIPQNTTLPSTAPPQVAVASPFVPDANTPTHVVQAGDTLSAIATRYNTTVATLLQANALADSNLLYVGQVIYLPTYPTDYTPSEWLWSDYDIVRSSDDRSFDLAAFMAQYPNSFLQGYTDTVRFRQADGSTDLRVLTGEQIIRQVALDYSVDERLLLALLEYRAGWLSQSTVNDMLAVYPLNSIETERDGLYRQLIWAADRINRAYYGSQYRDFEIIELVTNERLLLHPDLNAGTKAVQYILSLGRSYIDWSYDISGNGLRGLYVSLFGESDVMLQQPDWQIMTQPSLALPFGSDETWFYTGGPHGGWGSGSAWAAIDLAPPDVDMPVACYTSQYPVLAVADGVIVRSENGTVILDLDGDGLEETGWVVLYLHLATTGRVAAGNRVQTGDVIGYTSCEGGFSTATHLHIGRKYDGFWLPAYCSVCLTENKAFPTFNLGGWMALGYPNQEYQGELRRNGEIRQAEQGRLSSINWITW